ncbi:class D beta-lactamase [Rossellomorea marisflavi]|uniref:class D beta-lactamase n=1 Tax=Rossellomorea marisflavi TaxID=189381 RepID=UPI0028532587|nr:class D beta-lactamase [Rossellomorea marisflavi]MDR4938558.1 class D beta-lactamase [Rossellomorea marisflavi]
MKKGARQKFSRVVTVFFLAIFMVFAGLAPSHGAEIEKTKNLDVSGLFNGKEGTVVLKNGKNDKKYIYNKRRSQERLTPESTFKIPHSLIGLENHAIRDEYEVKRWDGIPRQFESWNRDHSLASAMRESAIWFYQDMARDIGEINMSEYINAIGYGNRDISGGIDEFWLDSTLKISAVEQVDFMEELVEEDLPFSKKTQKTVKRMMIQDEQDTYTLHGKTGTRLSDMKLGWYVGFIKTEKDTWLFAVNINGTGTEAKEILIDIAKHKGIID